MSITKKIINIIIFLLFLTSLILLISRMVADDDKQSQPREICFDGRCYFVEIADTESLREKGLMFRNGLDKNSGMLFIFEQDGDYPFWMKNTKMPLDIIWMDKNYEVVSIKTTDPCISDSCPNIDPGVSARYVLEINAGEAAKNNIKVGDKAEIK